MNLLGGKNGPCPPAKPPNRPWCWSLFVSTVGSFLASAEEAIPKSCQARLENAKSRQVGAASLASEKLSERYYMNLSQRVKRLEKRQGPAPPSIVEKVRILALAEALSTEDLDLLEVRLLKIKQLDSVENTPEYQDILRRIEPAYEATSLKLTGKSYADLLRGQAGDCGRRVR